MSREDESLRARATGFACWRGSFAASAGEVRVGRMRLAARQTPPRDRSRGSEGGAWGIFSYLAGSGRDDVL